MRGQTLEQAVQQEFGPLVFPSHLGTVWEWFLALHNRREKGINGEPSPISFEAMSAFFNLRRLRPAGWQVELIEDLDKTYRNTE